MSNVECLPFSSDVVSKIGRLVEMILDSVNDCQKIVLFGSYARAEYKASSDLDILVLTKAEVPRELRGELCSIFEENNADLVLYTTSIFENPHALLVQQIRKEGILLWQN